MANFFGKLPEKARREFFCLDEHTWVWHEEWTDTAGHRHVVTTRYSVNPQGIFKAQDGHPYQPLTPDEVRNFYHAAKLYNKRVKAELYGINE